MGSERDQKEAGKTLPICQAILLCDSVIRDEVTHKSTVVGIFDTFFVSSFPGQTSRSTIYLRLLEGAGRYDIIAEVQDAARGLVLFRAPGVAEFGHSSKKEPGELRLPIPPLRFDQDGTFDMVVFVDGHEIGRIEFAVRVGPEGESI